MRAMKWSARSTDWAVSSIRLHPTRTSAAFDRSWKKDKAMRIEHLINGKSSVARDYFETVDPATQEVLAEVARGGAEEVDAAVRAAKDAFPAWAGKPAVERAKLVRKLGE